ncbi:MAG: branched-chain-amino-acid transaminase [Nitrospirae bacterium]|nr:branched-chain-amino-acid transaminase [Nitrospirota bacterium]
MMVYLNNKLVPQNKAFISVFDHGFLYGDGVYETLRAYSGVAFKLDEHIERLFRSAEMIGLKVSKSHEGIKRAVYKTMKANNQKSAFIRINISRGIGPIGLDTELCPKPTFAIISNTFKEYPGEFYKMGVKIAIVNVRRNLRDALNPMIKSLNFLNNILANIEGKNRGAYEAVMLNYKGYVAEGTTSNIFFVKNSILYTPAIDVGILDGITRYVILDIARELGIKYKDGRFTREGIYSADEVFISSTTREIMPVSHVDNVKIGTKIGRITKTLLTAYRKKVEEYIEEHR